MELDDFKAQFNKATLHTPDHDIHELQQLIRNKSNSALHRFLRNFFMETLISVLVLVVLVWKIIHTLNTLPALFILTTVVLLAGYQTSFLRPAYKELKSFSSDSIKLLRQWSDRGVGLVDGLVTRYERFMVVTHPLGFFLAVCFCFSTTVSF